MFGPGDELEPDGAYGFARLFGDKPACCKYPHIQYPNETWPVQPVRTGNSTRDLIAALQFCKLFGFVHSTKRSFPNRQSDALLIDNQTHI